jgi:hypothetical protein
MKAAHTRLSALARDARGIASTEFVVLLVCICVAGLLTWRFFGRVVFQIITGDPRPY